MDSLDSRNLSLQDTTFLGNIEEDVSLFVTNSGNKRVLIFPPVSNFRRFLIHKLVEESFPLLKTFSLGEADARRTVICYKSDYQPDEKEPNEVVLEKPREPAKKPRTMPSLGIYRPPAARKLEISSSDGSETTREPLSRSSSNEIPAAKTPEGNVNSCDKKTARQRRPDMAVYVPRGRRIAEQHQRKLEESLNLCGDGVELHLESSPCNDQPRAPDDRVTFSPSIINNDSEKVDSENAANNRKNNEVATNIVKSVNAGSEIGPISVLTNGKSSIPESPPKVLEEVKTTSVHCDFPSNPVTIKKSVNISSSHVEAKENGSFKKSVDISSSPVDAKENGSNGTPVSSAEELDWDSLYDDSGECLDPTFLGQLTSAVGQVAIEKPKSSYDEYRHRHLDEEFPHVLEIYNFPSEFKTQDLIMIFSEYKQSGFEIKWVDDTHALGVFSSAVIASDVLALQHAFVKVRCLSEGTNQSKLKARKCADSLTPYMQRPDTCAALARRLVTGALGVKLPTLREEREAERRILKEAREKKRLAAKQREEAWEGTFS